MKPTIGRIVVYETTEDDRTLMRLSNNCNTQNKLPAIIVAVWGEDTVNLKVICDGDLNLWRTSVVKGSGPMSWDWPVIEK